MQFPFRILCRQDAACSANELPGDECGAPKLRPLSSVPYDLGSRDMPCENTTMLPSEWVNQSTERSPNHTTLIIGQHVTLLSILRGKKNIVVVSQEPLSLNNPPWSAPGGTQSNVDPLAGKPCPLGASVAARHAVGIAQSNIPGPSGSPLPAAATLL